MVGDKPLRWNWGLGILCSLLTVPPAIAHEAPPSWLMLYPQHPLYRQRASDPAIPTPKVSPVPAPLAPTPTRLPTPVLPSATATPQELATAPTPLFIQPLPEPETVSPSPTPLPGFTLASPSGFGLNWGEVFVGVSGVSRSFPRDNDFDKADGSIPVVVGLGNGRTGLGVEWTYNLISLTPSRFAANGNFDLKFHRMLDDRSSLALGVENFANYGQDTRETPISPYAVASTLWPLRPNRPENPMLLGLTLGVGAGRFSPREVLRREGLGDIGLLAAVGLQVLPNLAAILDWSGQYLSAGVSYVPFRQIPFYLSLSATDLLESTRTGFRFSFGAGLGLRF